MLTVFSSRTTLIYNGHCFFFDVIVFIFYCYLTDLHSWYIQLRLKNKTKYYEAILHDSGRVVDLQITVLILIS